MRILFLAQRVPYPPNRGDKISTWRLLKHMGRTHSVRCLAFAHDEEDLRAAEELTEMGYPTTAVPHHGTFRRILSLPLLATGKPLTLGVFGSSKMAALTKEAVAWADLIYAFSSSMGAFMLPFCQVPRIMHFAELDSDKWRQYSETRTFPMSWVYRREWRTLFSFEQRLAAAVEQNVFVTPLEERIFRDLIPGAPAVTLRNGVDLGLFAPRPELREDNHLVFTGVMDYLPNVDACRFFVSDVLPLIRQEIPAVRFSIVGSKPTAEVQHLAQAPGVTVTGFVDSTADWLARASVAVAPIRIARGIQNKVLEAMAMGLPVVSTTTASQGVEGQAGEDYLVADDAGAMAQAICGLLKDREAAQNLGKRARRFVEENYDWEQVFAPLDQILDQAQEAHKLK
ncbi:MAG: TIGR03087 family PEP-CTERM/XrtA system glycosyltransferase [Planctomycetota bacterium]|nr:TIGR03087 family PEP-CTERM/XrtA system glycosyltransferase [Planctomycetota bacterium]MDP6520556.1 TIGR03087 family PEP-CTERM/XrtA system glycosyltransferase [Planctomycetota bacterium]MDP6838047.1 TIGR03087 family PEP-CTERM/XrtA system glycosyltransferase [Planctomycetota bacterium]